MADAEAKARKPWSRWPKFLAAETLTAERLNNMVEDQQRRLQMLMRALHGHGVIFGLAPALGEGGRRLELSCGMALDRHGRLLHWPGGPIEPCDIVRMPEEPGEYTLFVHYAHCEQASGECGPCSERADWIEEAVVFTLQPGCRDWDRNCPQLPDADCLDLEDYLCLRTGSAGPDRGAGATRQQQQQLKAAAERRLPPAPDLEWACRAPPKPCRIDCGECSYDRGAGIPLACLRITDVRKEERCEPCLVFDDRIEPCAVRPYVYRTPLLYELVRGCHVDLARVESLGWQEYIVGAPEYDWENAVAWDMFAGWFHDPKALTIRFTKPMRVATLHASSVFLTAIISEKDADYWLARRVPAALEPIKRKGDLAEAFRIEVDPEWVRNEIDSRSYLREGGRLELTIRGQMLRDQCGNLLNAVPLHYAPKTPPQNQPGGDFVAVVRFGAAPPVKPSPPPSPRPRRTERRY